MDVKLQPDWLEEEFNSEAIGNSQLLRFSSHNRRRQLHPKSN